MMSANYLTNAAFALICLVLLTLPFVPAYREWRHPSDIAALPISPNYSSDIDHFARRLKADATAKLGVGMPTGYEDFDFVSHPVESMDWSRAAKRLISPDSIDTSVAIRNSRPIYVEGDIRAGAGSAFSALYATGNVELVHINGSVVTVTLGGGRTGAGLADIVRGLFLHYGPQPADPTP